MKGYVIDVRGFSEEKKKRVQDAFFELGLRWSRKSGYKHLDADTYGNVFPKGATTNLLMHDECVHKIERPYEITYEELMRESGININPEDEVTITTNYRQLLKVWAMMGASNGIGFPCRYNIYSITKEIFGLSYSDSIATKLGGINYYSIQEELEARVFGPKETEQGRKIRELREQAECLLNKAKELEESTND